MVIKHHLYVSKKSDMQNSITSTGKKQSLRNVLVAFLHPKNGEELRTMSYIYQVAFLIYPNIQFILYNNIFISQETSFTISTLLPGALFS